MRARARARYQPARDTDIVEAAWITAELKILCENQWGRCLNAPVTGRWRSIKPARNNRHYPVHAHRPTGADASDKIAETIVMERNAESAALTLVRRSPRGGESV